MTPPSSDPTNAQLVANLQQADAENLELRAELHRLESELALYKAAETGSPYNADRGMLETIYAQLARHLEGK